MLDRYDIWKLIYGDRLKLPSVFKFRSLSEPFVPSLWACLGFSTLILCLYVLVRTQSLDFIASFGLILSAWLGNVQAKWAPKVERKTNFKPLILKVTVCAFFLTNMYCAYVQTHIVVPGSFRSSKTFEQLVQENFTFYAFIHDYEMFQELVGNQKLATDCATFGGCNSTEYQHHQAVSQVLQAFRKGNGFDPHSFYRLEKKAILGPEKLWSTDFAGLAWARNRNYFTTQDEYLKRPRFWDFHYMPEHDVVIDVYERLQQAGIVVWAKEWPQYYKKVLTNKNVVEFHAYTLTEDTIIAESLLVCSFGLAASLSLFLIVEILYMEASRGCLHSQFRRTNIVSCLQDLHTP